MDWLLNNNSVLDRGSDWFTGIRAKVFQLTIQIRITIIKTRNTSCFTNSHESFETFQFKYTNQVYVNVYGNFLLLSRTGIKMTNPCS